MKINEFIAAVAPITVKVRIDGGVLFPSVSIAQSILETGARIHDWYNLVGYKVGSGKLTPYWSGRSVSTKTWEVFDGVRYDGVTANWRAYDTIEDGLKDQALLFIGNSRYQRVIDARTPEAQCTALLECGYATDPAYPVKLVSLIRANDLTRFDREAKEMLERLAALEARVEAQEARAAAQDARVAELEARVASLEARTAEVPPPEWAAGAVKKLVDRKLLADPNGDRSFHRTLVVLDRAGVFEGGVK